MDLTATTVGITGVGGNVLSTGWPGLPAVRGSGGATVIDPVITVTGAIAPSIPVPRRTVPSLDLDARVRGATAGAALRGVPGDAFTVQLSRPIAPLFVPWLNGSLAIDVGSSVQLAAGRLDPVGGMATFGVPVVGDPALAGVVFAVPPGALRPLMQAALARRLERARAGSPLRARSWSTLAAHHGLASAWRSPGCCGGPCRSPSPCGDGDGSAARAVVDRRRLGVERPGRATRGGRVGNS